MDIRNGDVQLGAMALVVAAAMAFVVIPTFVSTPSNVPNPVLSPLFWPYALTLFTALVGIGLLLSAWRAGRAERAGTAAAAETDDPFGEPEDRGAAVTRLVAVAVMMLVMLWLLPLFGMVWTSMVVFVALAFLVRTAHPRTAVICAVAVPLVLYAFFAHVAGISIPQGSLAADYVRLP